MKFINKQFLLFILLGVLNTGMTYLLYLLMLSFAPYGISYTITYILGIPVSYILNSKFAFKTKLSFRKMFQYPLVYIIQYLINMICMFLLVDLLNIDDKFSPIVVTIITVPVTYLLSKKIITNKV
ncbi:GtrA family protein [Paenibacillus validus]|nr:GtrA family protein [Paenibacillus validus]MED4599485.1 GtrA family protein [Paenibacillus validus]MED4606719.1 GtrA family protein [Paenibacillus validus]